MDRLSQGSNKYLEFHEHWADVLDAPIKIPPELRCA